MTVQDYSELLPQLRFHLREDGGPQACGCCGLTDAQLLALLENNGGDLRAAAYEGLLRKAEDDSIRLPDGLEVPSARAYWLSLARLYRPCAGRNMPRADEVFDNEA